MTFQAEKHTYTNSNLLLLKIELLNQKCHAQGSVTCLAGPDSASMAPFIPTPVDGTPQLCVSGSSQRQGSSIYQGSCSYPADKESNDPRARGRVRWPMVTCLTITVPLGTQAAPCSSPVSAMTTGTWQVNTFSLSTCRGDNILMPSTHRAPEPLASPLFLKTEFLASADNFEKGGNKTISSGACHGFCSILCGEEHGCLWVSRRETEAQRSRNVLSMNTVVEHEGGKNSNSGLCGPQLHSGLST